MNKNSTHSGNSHATPVEMDPLKQTRNFTVYLSKAPELPASSTNLFFPYTHPSHVAEIFKPLGVSLGASLESRLSPCSWLLCLGSTPNKAKGGRAY